MTSQCLASSDGDVCSWLFLFLQEKGARPARPVSCRRSKVSYIPPPHPAPPPPIFPFLEWVQAPWAWGLLSTHSPGAGRFFSLCRWAGSAGLGPLSAP